MAEEFQIKVGLDNAQAIRQAKAFKRQLATTTDVGGRMTNAFMGYFAMIAGPAGIMMVIKGLLDLQKQMRAVDNELNAFYQKQAQRASQAADKLTADWVTDLQTVMQGKTRTQVYQWAGRTAQQFGARAGAAGVGQMAFPVFSAFGAGERGQQALSDTLTAAQGGPMAYGPAGAWMGAMEKQLSGYDPSLGTRAGQQAGMASMIGAAQQSVFTTGEMATAAKIAVPMLMHGGSDLPEALAITGALGHGFSGEPTKAGMVVRRLYLFAMGGAPPEFESLAAEIGISRTDMRGNYMSRWLSKMFAWMNAGTPEEKRRKLVRMQAGGIQQRVAGGMMQVSAGYEKEKRNIAAAMGQRTWAGLETAADTTRKEWWSQFKGSQAGAEAGQTEIPAAGTMGEASWRLGLLVGTVKDEGKIAATPGYQAGLASYRERHDREHRADIGTPHTNAQQEKLYRLDIVGAGVYRQLEALRARFEQGRGVQNKKSALSRAAASWMGRLANASSDAHERVYWTSWVGTTEDRLNKYELTIQRAMHFVRQVGMGGIVESWIRGGTIDTSGMGGGAGSPEFWLPSGEKIPFSGYPTEQNAPIAPAAPGKQQSMNVNMLIQNFGGVPQGLSQIKRGGTWRMPDPMGYV